MPVRVRTDGIQTAAAAVAIPQATSRVAHQTYPTLMASTGRATNVHAAGSHLLAVSLKLSSSAPTIAFVIKTASATSTTETSPRFATEAAEMMSPNASGNDSFMTRRSYLTRCG